MTGEHLRGRGRLPIQVIPVAFHTFSVRARSSFHKIERKGAVAFFFMTLKVELGNERAEFDTIRNMEVLGKEGHPRGKVDEPLTRDVVGDGAHS